MAWHLKGNSHHGHGLIISRQTSLELIKEGFGELDEDIVADTELAINEVENLLSVVKLESSQGRHYVQEDR